MCYPFTIAMTVAEAGTGLKAYGKYQASASASEAATIKGANNVKQAAYERAAAEWDAKRVEDKAERLTEKQKAGYFASGFTLSGTAEAVIGDSRAEAEKDIQAIMRSAEIKARNYEAEGGMYAKQATSYAQAAGINATTTLIGGFMGQQSAGA